MSRVVDSDFVLLQAFLESYRLPQLGANSDLLSIVKRAHKYYLAFLQFWAIFSAKALAGEVKFFGEDMAGDGAEIQFLRETVSDIGSSFFCCLHGAYKPGHMALRSGIENFLRFASGSFDQSALVTTSISDLFDLSKEVTPFSGNRKQYLNQLRSDYADLCKFTHSASIDHMAGVNALVHFPSFDKGSFEGWLRVTKACMTTMVSVTIVGAPPIYLDAHFTAKEIMDILIPRAERILILKGPP